MGKRWSEHTTILPELQKGDTVQLQNLTGIHPLKADDNGIIVGKNNINSYSGKVHGSNLLNVRNRAILCKILTVAPIHNVMFGQGMKQTTNNERMNERTNNFLIIEPLHIFCWTCGTL